MKTKGKKILRITLISFSSFLLLTALLIFSLRFGFMQDFLKDRIISYIEDKIKTPVSLERVYIGFPNTLEIENLHLKGQKVDTLLYAQKLEIGLDMWQLINSKADITHINLEGINTHIVRNENGSFNFDYILNAFASDKKEEKKESKPFILSLDKIKLSDIRVQFTDLQAKNNLKLYFSQFDTRIKKFDVEQNTYALGSISLDGLRFKLQQDLVEEIANKVEQQQEEKEKKGKPLQLSLGNIKLTNFNIDYQDAQTKTFAKILFDELSAKINHLDLEKQRYDVQFAKLLGANIDANLYLPTTQKTKETSPNTQKNNTPQPFLKLGRLQLDDVKAKYHNTAVKPTQHGMDFNHLNFANIHTDIQYFKMENGAFSGRIQSAQIQEARGLNLQKLHTDFAYTDKEISLKKLHLQTPQTLLREEISLHFNSPEQLQHNLGNTHITALVPNAKIGFQDILLFAPDLRNTAPFNQFPKAILQLNTRIKGKINNLNIHNLQANGLGDATLALSGTIKNATNPKTLAYDLNIREISASAHTLQKLLPPNTLPNNITLPNTIKLSGIAQGTTQKVDTHLNLHSTDGNAKIIAKMDMKHKNAEHYNISAYLTQLNIGKIIKNKDLGIIDGHIQANGIGFAPQHARIEAKGNIHTLDYNKYRYQNIALHASMKNGAYRIQLNSKDTNANMNLLASGIYSEKNPTVKVSGDIQKLDLHTLNFYQEPLAIAGKINGDFSNLNPDILNGQLQLQNFAIADKTSIIPIQEINIKATSTTENNKLSIQSQILDLEMNGKYHLTKIFNALQNTLNQYYTFQKPSQLPKTKEGQYFTLSANIKNDDLIQKFVPDLKDFETINIEGKYQSDQGDIQLHLDFPRINFAQNIIEKGKLEVYNQNNALQYKLHIDKLNTDKIAFNQAEIKGHLAENTLHYTLSTQDEKGKEQFLIAGNLNTIGENSQLSLLPNGLKINYQPWTVDPENQLHFGKNGFWAKNFSLSHQQSQINIHSQEEKPNSPLNINIKNFKIEDITEIIKKDSLLAKGNINGEIQLQNLQKNPTINADVLVSNLEIFGNAIGNISAKAKHTHTHTISSDIRLDGLGNEMNISGDFNTQNQSLNMLAQINALSMKSVQGLSMNALEEAEGYLSGKLNISGKASAPRVLGKIQFNNVGMKITQTGSHFKDINDAILFQNDGLHFDNFKLKDTQGNALVADGKIRTQNFKDFAFDMSLHADNFKVVDAPEDQEKMMYGMLAINADLKIGGDLHLPKINGDLGITDDTNFTFVLPQTSPTLKEREGIVEFIDQDKIALTNTLPKDSIDTQTKVKGMDVSVNISLTPNAKISLLIDKANGDFVEMQGKAQLTGGIDPSGKTTLVGVYQVEKGAYEMSISMLKRKFDIEKGSTITWTGEPTAAKLNLTAVYTTNAAPLDLLQQQLTSEQINYYKQRIPFDTKLILGGELLKPIIKFDITVDDEVNVVSREVLDNTKTKLQQLRNDESQLAKQVFALLTLNRFLGENPFHSESGVSAGTMLRQSVSQILSQQLNNLATELIAGVDLSFDLDSYEDYSTGNKNTRTDLNVNLSKNLLNDRLKISVGSNFGVEGSARKNEKMNNIAGNINIDYLLSQNGAYKLRAYRKNDYQVALQGQIIETGLGFIITLDYDHFRDILLRRQQNKTLKKLEKNNPYPLNK